MLTSISDPQPSASDSEPTWWGGLWILWSLTKRFPNGYAKLLVKSWLLLTLTASPALVLASDPGTRIIDPTGAAMPTKPGCNPQIVVTVPDFPEAEHVSASTVMVDFGDSRICSHAAGDPEDVKSWIEALLEKWFPRSKPETP